MFMTPVLSPPTRADHRSGSGARAASGPAAPSGARATRTTPIEVASQTSFASIHKGRAHSAPAGQGARQPRPSETRTTMTLGSALNAATPSLATIASAPTVPSRATSAGRSSAVVIAIGEA
jgi:hypothetical protein